MNIILADSERISCDVSGLGKNKQTNKYLDYEIEVVTFIDALPNIEEL
jgi:hypothetical protein